MGSGILGINFMGLGINSKLWRLFN